MPKEKKFDFDLEQFIILNEELDAIGRFMVKICPDIPMNELGEEIIGRTEKVFEITGTYKENFGNPKEGEA